MTKSRRHFCFTLTTFLMNDQRVVWRSKLITCSFWHLRLLRVNTRIGSVRPILREKPLKKKVAFLVKLVPDKIFNLCSSNYYCAHGRNHRKVLSLLLTLGKIRAQMCSTSMVIMGVIRRNRRLFSSFSLPFFHRTVYIPSMNNLIAPFISTICSILSDISEKW
jgi:hypothetical protein